MYDLGLALSGGGSKGIAHAGVLKFLNEKNIVPDVLAGTSAGAIVAALYVRGKTPEEIVSFFKSVYFFRWTHFALTKPGGFIHSDVFKKYLLPVFGDMVLDDLEKRVYITATNMISGKLEIFGGGIKVVDAIIASCAVPMVATPYKIGTQLYSDGGILNNFPADVLKYRSRKIIGVYFSPQKKVQASELKNMVDITSRAYDLMTTQAEIGKSIYCDWFINPKDLAKYNLFETRKTRMDEIFNIGYQTAAQSFREGIV
ncbi:patatin-like phospholipase family protein [Bergeyella sp. RCAD1439]|uniref:patatin-like phospholipase family protein n=1 Tax=Bergeyella anatis TaxID=3113737 RepID=UPI002E1843AF|nr:patatin-like phospholipase family protein [Bergeyella sp. RCAD1439]